MDEKTRKMVDDVIMESKRFQQQHKPPKIDKVGDFLSFTKRKFSDLANYFLQDTGSLPGGGHKKRNACLPRHLQIR